jgi:hypothetical protein
MKKLVRKQELQAAYDRIMARENLQFVGPQGSGKNYLKQALNTKLKGRRIIFEINFQGLFALEELVFRFRSSLEKSAEEHQGLEYQLRRLHQEFPIHQFKTTVDFYEYLRKLREVFIQAGQDFLFEIHNPELCELEELKIEEFISQFYEMTKARNVQFLLISAKNLISEQECISFNPVLAEDVWQEAPSNAPEIIAYCRGNLRMIQSVHQMAAADLNFKAEDFFKSHLSHFLMLKNRFTPLQWRLLRSIASHEEVVQPHAFQFLVNHKLGAASSVERALRNLLDSEYVERTEIAYRVKDPLLHRWLQYVYYAKTL